MSAVPTRAAPLAAALLIAVLMPACARSTESPAADRVAAPDDHERGIGRSAGRSPTYGAPENDDAVIGVALVAHGPHHAPRIRVRGPWRLESLDGGAIADRGRDLDRELGSADAGRRLVPDDGQGFAIDGRAYDGDLVVTKGPDGRLHLANRIRFGDYLAGVLVAEMPPGSPREALRAQAVLARSYAIARIDGLTDSPGLHQAYHGRPPASRRSLLDHAVGSTAGLRLVDGDGEDLPGYWYHSTCGGRTTTAASVFGVPPTPAYAGVECRWCTSSKYFTWDVVVPEERLRAALRFGSRVAAVTPAHEDPSGRSTVLRATAAGGTVVDVPLLRIRGDLGPNVLRSTLLTDVAAVAGPEGRPAFRFAGRGWGHGVGLCQIGAFTLAREGRTAEAILAVYYPGTRIVGPR